MVESETRELEKKVSVEIMPSPTENTFVHMVAPKEAETVVEAVPTPAPDGVVVEIRYCVDR